MLSAILGSIVAGMRAGEEGTVGGKVVAGIGGVARVLTMMW